MNITHSLTINSDLSWLLLINHHMVDSNRSTALKPFSGAMNTDKLNRLLELLDQLKVCAGQPDKHYVHMVSAKKGKILSPHGKVVAYFDRVKVDVNGEIYQQTLCTSDHEIASHSLKCPAFTSYRSNLHSMYHRWVK